MSGKESIWELTPTKEKISIVALQLFSKKGFKGTTMKDIARKVGITEGAIYRHFRSKEEIVTYLINRISREINLMIKEKVLSQKEIKSRIAKLVDVLINYAFENPDAFRFLTVYHILNQNGTGVRLPGNLIMAMLREAYRYKQISTSPEIALSLIVGSIERLFILWEMNLITLPKGKLIEELRYSILKALF